MSRLRVVRSPAPSLFYKIVAVSFFVVLVGTAGVAIRTDAKFTELVVALTALIGAFALYAESRRGKNIAMGEFILNLNSEFDTNSDRAEIHRKIVSGQALTEVDKPALVAYLTFFEIIYRLVVSNVVKMDVVDDLFRSRFFRAVHHVDVQDLELLPDADGYRNIYELERLWVRHLSRQGIDLQRGDRQLPNSAYLRSTHQVHFSLREVDQADAAMVHRLITAASETMLPEAFVVNDLATIEKQMQSGLTVVACRRSVGEPVGVLHVYFPQDGESLARYLASVDDQFPAEQVAHMDIAAVAPEHRGYGLLTLLLIYAECRLQELDPKKSRLFATVHPSNKASIRSFEFVGYEVVGEITIHGSLPRLLLAKGV